jgi:hypothetical protein
LFAFLFLSQCSRRVTVKEVFGDAITFDGQPLFDPVMIEPVAGDVLTDPHI